jgi:tetratricopeptide (TPR) repeat protein
MFFLNRSSRNLLLFALLAVSCLAYPPLHGQEKPSPENPRKPAAHDAKPKPSAPESMEDIKALAEIAKQSVPQKKLDALEKFKADFPQSSRVASADQQILEVLVREFPDRKERILDQANHNIMEAAEKPEAGTPFSGRQPRSSVCNSIAGLFADNGIFLEKAEEFALQGISLLDESLYVQEQKNAYGRRKKAMEESAAKRATSGDANEPPPSAPALKEPSDEELGKQFARMKAGYAATLGKIYLKMNRIEEARKQLRAAHEADPKLVPAAIGLGELAMKEGDYREAINYFIPSALSGRMPPGARKQLEESYFKVHGGSLEGLEEMLDESYRKEFPLPFSPEAYRPAPARSHRTVLSEVFTGSGCPPCVAADLAFEAAMKRYSPSEMVVLMYHLHIPQPDPISNPSTQARAKFYGVRGVPSVYVDGTSDGKGGGPRENARPVYDRINPMIEKRLETPAGVSIRLEAGQNGRLVTARVKVDPVASDAKSLKLQIALVEAEVIYSGENAVRFHPMVVRSLGGPEATGYPFDSAKGAEVEQVFELDKITAELKAHLDDYEVNGRHGKITFRQKKHEISSRHLKVAAFVQDEGSKAILQAAIVDCGSAGR